MIRFIPDTWLEAFLRFFAMAAPDANVYAEIPAPDLRFAAIVLLALAAALCWRRIVAWQPVVALLSLVVVSAVPWLLTSGNGRYWMPMLLMAGPLAIGLIRLVPWTRGFKLFLALGLVAAQGFVTHESSPSGAWAWAEWGDPPYFAVDIPKPEALGHDTTYITLSTISYSLIAPQFPASSRWMNLTSVGGTGRDAGWAQDFLRAAPGAIKLLVPTIEGQFAKDLGPAPATRQAVDEMLISHRLKISADASCELMRAHALGKPARGGPRSEPQGNAGFWICPLQYPVDAQAGHVEPLDPAAEAAFAQIEGMCPRFFAPGQKTVRIHGGRLRNYPGSDMKIYVLDDGTVLYKFWRALNPVLVGRRDQVLAGKARIDCDNIRGRSGLPWQREI